MTDGNELVELELDPTEFARVMREIKTVEPKIATAIRKSIRGAAKLVVSDVEAEIRSYPARRYNTGMREKLAAGLAVRIGTAKGGTKQGVFIVSTGKQLPEGKRALVKAMNRAEFRHPTYASGRKRSGTQKRVWVAQEGMRYFRQSILTAREAELTEALKRAVQDATEALNA